MAGHDRIAALSSAGRNQVVPNTGHHIQLRQPQIVIAAIREFAGIPSRQDRAAQIRQERVS